jgi:hypothetical protein
MDSPTKETARKITVPRAYCGAPDYTNNEIPDTHRVISSPHSVEIATDLKRVVFIGQKRKTIEDNINLANNAVSGMLPTLNDIKQQYIEITRLEAALGKNKKRLKKCREEIVRKVVSYTDAASNYINERNQFINELNTLANKFDGSTVKGADSLKETSTEEVVKLEMINRIQLNQTIKLINQTQLEDNVSE